MKKQKKEKVVIPLKRVVHAHKFRKRERGIMMTHRFRNPRSQKEDMYTHSGQIRQSLHRSSMSSPHVHRSSHRAAHPSPHLHRPSHQANHPSPHNHHSADHSRSAPHPNSPAFPQFSPDHRARRSAISQTSEPPQEPVVCLAGLAATQVSIRHSSKGVVRVGCYTRVR